jgi:fructokinase
MVLVIGEILFDIFPAYKRIGGAAFNFAFHLKKMGFPVRFVSRICNDPNGRKILIFLKKHGFDIRDIQVDTAHKTGIVNIQTGPDSDHRFIIANDTAYDHIKYNSHIEDLVNGQPELIYFGTLIQRTKNNFRLIKKISELKPQKTKWFCDINLRPGCYNEKIIQAALRTADILKLNHEELLKITNSCNPSLPYKAMADQMMKTHDLNIVILTLGSHGSQWFTPGRHYKNLPVDTARIVDTVGAGDAYAAMSAACLLGRVPIEKTICLAEEFAAHICSIKGALPENTMVYQQFIKKMGQ